MPEFNNLKDLEKFLKKNMKTDFVVGQVITYECPVCESEQEVKMLQNNKALCLNCNSTLEVTFDVK